MHLKKSYIIFICTEDVFGQKRYQYTFRNLCLEDKALELNDGATKIFFNTKGKIGDISPEVCAFLKYVDGQASNDEFVKRLENEVQRIKNDEDWRLDYMTLFDKIEEAREEALAKAEEKIKEVQKEAQKKIKEADDKFTALIKNLVKATGFPEEKIREMVNMTNSESAPAAIL